MADFQVVVWGPEWSEGTTDTLRVLHVVLETSVCVMDAFRTEYKAILYHSNPKLGYNNGKIPIRG